MKKQLLTLLLIWASENCFSQTDFRRGYVITNAKDTLFGLVDYREGAKAYKTCAFKKSKNLNEFIYEPSGIIGYGFDDDKYFQSREIFTKGQSSEAVFLEVIVKGLVSLYKFENIFFVEKDNNGLQQLINEREETIVNGITRVKNTNQHIVTLNMLLYDCSEISAKVQRIGLDEKALTKLITEYNNCQGDSSIIFKAKKPWVKALIGITGGVNNSQLNYDPSLGYAHLTGEFEASTSPIVGASLDILSPRINERLSFQSHIFFLTSQYYKYSFFQTNFSTEINYVTIELQQLKIPIGFRYIFPTRSLTPYFGLGLSSTVHLSTSSSWIQVTEFNNVVEIKNNEVSGLIGNQLGVWGGCGISKSIHDKLNVFVEFRYEQTDGISQGLRGAQSDLQSKIMNFQILIGIRTN